MNRPIAMTAFNPPRPRQDERPRGTTAGGAPAGKVDYWLVTVCVVYVVFAILGFFAAGEITVY